MERHERPTVMDGKVVTFAERFEDTGPGIFGRNMDARGPYEISASRNAVIVHEAELHDLAQVEAFIAAVRAAAKEASELSRTAEWGGKFCYSPPPKDSCHE